MARTRETIGEVVLKGAKNADGKLVTQRDQDLLVKECYGTSVPSATTGYAMGCTFFNTSTGHIYVNTGSVTSCTFNDVGSISSSEIDANAITPIKMGTRTLVALADSAATPTIAQLMTSSIFTMTPAAARTFTTPTATLMVAGITGATAGSWFDFTIENLSASTVNYGITLTAGADVTLSGNAVVYSGSGSFRVTITGVTVPTVTIHRLDDAVSAVLSGVTAGTAAVSKALVLGASGELATITSATITTLTAPTVNATNIDAGASAVPGTVDIFPSTASRGKLTISCTDNTDNFGTVLTNAANSTSTKTATIPALTGYVGLSTAALSLAEMDVLASVTQGTAAASKALVLNAAAGITTGLARLQVSSAPAALTTPSLGVGVYGTPVVDVSLLDNIAFTANMSTATNKTAADTSCMAAFIGVSNTAATTNNKMQGLLVSNGLNFNCYDAYAVQGHTTVAAAGVSTQNANAHITGLSGKVNLAGAVGQGWVSGVLAIMEGVGAVTGLCHVIAAQVEATCTDSVVDAVLFLGADAIATTAIKCEGGEHLPAFLDMNGMGNAGFVTTGGTDCTASAATDPSYTIKVIVPGGGAGYIRVWAAA